MARLTLKTRDVASVPTPDNAHGVLACGSDGKLIIKLDDSVVPAVSLEGELLLHNDTASTPGAAEGTVYVAAISGQPEVSYKNLATNQALTAVGKINIPVEGSFYDKHYLDRSAALVWTTLPGESTVVSTGLYVDPPAGAYSVYVLRGELILGTAGYTLGVVGNLMLLFGPAEGTATERLLSAVVNQGAGPFPAGGTTISVDNEVIFDSGTNYDSVSFTYAGSITLAGPFLPQVTPV